jgi:hypothetical protein
MRALSALVLLSSLTAALTAGCTPSIPVKDDFGTSALVMAGPTPPEFAEFNAYDPTVNPLLADQMCATQYQLLQEKSVGASPGRIIRATGRCRTHVPIFGDPIW